LTPDQWEKEYANSLFDKTKDYMPKGTNADNILDKLDHTCTDKFHPESYGSSETAVDKIMSGNTHLIQDPQQVGQAITYKGTKHFAEADAIRAVNPAGAENEVAEGMRQLTKQYTNQVEAAANHYGTGMDSKLQQAIKIMDGINNGQTPIEVEKALKSALGMTKDDVASQLGQQFEYIVKTGRMAK
jgi:hypothetical protein